MKKHITHFASRSGVGALLSFLNSEYVDARDDSRLLSSSRSTDWLRSVSRSPDLDTSSIFVPSKFFVLSNFMRAVSVAQ